jgi:transcriptional regulator with XRE-family HTH domain
MAPKSRGKRRTKAAPSKRRAKSAASKAASTRASMTDDGPSHPGRSLSDRLREMRSKRGWTLEQLASLSFVSRSMLSQIERGTANPTLGVAFRIAEAFGVSLSDLVDVPAVAPKIDVIRGDDRTHLFRDDVQCRIRTLSPLRLEKDVEFYELTLKSGGALRSAPHFEGTREFLAVEKGTVRLTSGSESTELGAGDSAHYPADVPHRIENVGRGEAVAFLVDIYARTSARRK